MDRAPSPSTFTHGITYVICFRIFYTSVFINAFAKEKNSFSSETNIYIPTSFFKIIKRVAVFREVRNLLRVYTTESRCFRSSLTLAKLLYTPYRTILFSKFTFEETKAIDRLIIVDPIRFNCARDQYLSL